MKKRVWVPKEELQYAKNDACEKQPGQTPKGRVGSCAFEC